ncbi:MAG: hypothetical protein LBL71_04750 [Endomicrobium sp.]|jgi:Holliday junction DNA helicase RuvA|nr:hypothetical protein [Endomicrobium sp.]
MLDYVSGTIESKSANTITIDVNGIGYDIAVAAYSFSKLPETGSQVKVYVAESISGMYGGVIYLYGFLTKEERNIYFLIKDQVPKTGAKKAMEYMDKISKSFPDFKTALVSKNTALLHDIFGFTKKTADKLVTALKDKIAYIEVSGREKWLSTAESVLTENKLILDAVDGLLSLGYREQQAKAAVNKIYKQNKNITLENLITKSLQEI